MEPGTPYPTFMIVTAIGGLGGVIGTAGAVGALGGLFINLAFRQAFLTAQTGEPAYWAFLAFYVACGAVTWAMYRRPTLAELARPRLACAGV
jgi:NNP family nitrate/nitrite transporter-like MFS transporter